jgi:ankyrin repeat protein
MMFTLGEIKGIVKSLLKENGDPRTIFSFENGEAGRSVLHLAAYKGHLEICKYLVEDLGGDVNAPGVVAGVGGFFLTFHS